MNINKSKNVFKITLSISFLIHISIALLLYFNLDSKKIVESKKNKEKISLSFKRGGDSKKENSNVKENTSIPQHILQQTLSASAIINEIKPNTSLTSKDFSKADKIIKNINQNNTIDFNSLQIYSKNNININSLQNIKSQQYKNAFNYIMAQNIPQDQKYEIIDLYGDELGDYGMAEIDFLVNNLRDIGRITQYHINRRGYPKEAAILKQSGKNILEFFLYPNGDISDLKIVSSSKSLILDKDIQTNVKAAFREYPRPTTKVKIIINMTYSLSMPS
ncbi:TonB family protein [Helicobacter sp. MIT 14-3879]|uniref:TonB family protein n=1 Tax=Helicobacter sp. MIT 14-3879 TaxID=2040649 RepID=UPI0015F16840|nr:TonB family protein [Helicobacter sp. MIT 14-3879]